jgi:hypothetical protein
MKQQLLNDRFNTSSSDVVKTEKFLSIFKFLNKLSRKKKL